MKEKYNLNKLKGYSSVKFDENYKINTKIINIDIDQNKNFNITYETVINNKEMIILTKGVTSHRILKKEKKLYLSNPYRHKQLEAKARIINLKLKNNEIKDKTLDLVNKHNEKLNNLINKNYINFIPELLKINLTDEKDYITFKNHTLRIHSFEIKNMIKIFYISLLCMTIVILIINHIQRQEKLMKLKLNKQIWFEKSHDDWLHIMTAITSGKSTPFCLSSINQNVCNHDTLELILKIINDEVLGLENKEFETTQKFDEIEIINDDFTSSKLYIKSKHSRELLCQINYNMIHISNTQVEDISQKIVHHLS